MPRNSNVSKQEANRVATSALIKPESKSMVTIEIARRIDVSDRYHPWRRKTVGDICDFDGDILKPQDRAPLEGS